MNKIKAVIIIVLYNPTKDDIAYVKDLAKAQKELLWTTPTIHLSQDKR